MEYMTVKTAAKKWNISARRIQIMCTNDLIEGATHFGKAWAIPISAEKPIDRRIKSGKYIKHSKKGFLLDEQHNFSKNEVTSFNIWNRRYTGSKYKLSDWIKTLIAENCQGISFCDIFAGTGIIAASEIGNFEEIILNDFLYSNNMIYKAFFEKSKYNKSKLKKYINDLTSISISQIPDNYFSDNFGGKYFSFNDAKIIGYIRESIENDKSKFTSKEYSILIASLLYSADKIANTVGHYDAYIKGKKIPNSFTFSFIEPIDVGETKIKIYQEDANELAKKIKCDVVYIDPPYNSRQYSRFYHVLENLTKWEKPELTGTAMKPPPENMSEYCRASAPNVFKDLIESLDCKYIVVSYNNTYNSKSSSSRNKIEFDNLKDILRNKGELKIVEKQHQFFNAGKTDFSDHKEYIFIVKVR